MSGFLSLIITFVVVIKIIDIFVINHKERKKYQPTPKQFYKKMNKEILNQMEISHELKRIEEDKPLYPLPENEDIIRWNKAFLKSLEWKRYEEVCMEYLRLKNCDADVTSIGADGGIDMKFNIHAQRTWNCINPLEGGQAVLHRRQACELSTNTSVNLKNYLSSWYFTYFCIIPKSKPTVSTQ